MRTVDQLAELFNSLGLETDADTVRATIENYDKAIMAGEQPEGVKKTNPNALIGSADKDENGNYLPETYKLDGVELRIRFMAPSTHHTMGGIKVDTERHALDADGNVIPGLYGGWARSPRYPWRQPSRRATPSLRSSFPAVLRRKRFRPTTSNSL